jgi:hypothetical protein
MSTDDPTDDREIESSAGEQAPVPSSPKAPRPPALPLSYASASDNQKRPWEPPGPVARTSVWVQFLLGMTLPLVACAGCAMLVSRMDRRGDWTVWAGFFGIVAVAIVGAVARARYGWRAFFPGMMLSLVLVAAIFGAGVLVCFARVSHV